MGDRRREWRRVDGCAISGGNFLDLEGILWAEKRREWICPEGCGVGGGQDSVPGPHPLKVTHNALPSPPCPPLPSSPKSTTPIPSTLPVLPPSLTNLPGPSTTLPRPFQDHVHLPINPLKEKISS
ncbi:hypothetical protein E2C01_063106 [Portunus trituberculatus]|uniref:Uncharacterized protein n=1 Tax=Portunus trituberculatus TaxID=210409 RepID=A0A5B7HH80_PORTR|nr:hypothetical protein [Portunus trituberculatus]